MKRYERYKPSGIDWIGEIPDHWEVLCIRRITTNHKQGFYSNDEYTKDGIKLLRITDIDDNSNINLSDCPKVSISQEEYEDFSLKKDDFVFARSGTIGRFGIVRNEEEEVIFASYLIRFRFTEKIFIGFLKCYFLSNIFREALIRDLHGGANKNVHAENIKDQILCLPPFEEQTYISNYLDQKTAEIDDLIAKKQKLIDLLNEEKTAIINQAVTKGLNPDTPMKGSGIPWLGERPAHWEVRKLKYVSKINPEALTENTKEDFRFFYIDISSVDSEGNITDLIELLFKDAPSRARRIVKREDTIISTVRTYLKAIAFIQREDRNLICSTGFSVIRPDPKVFRPKFLFYLLRSDKIINAISSLSKGVSYPAIDSEDLAEIATWFPPREEQDAILNYIEANKNRIDKTISKINKEIGLLQEYRTALISEAVTGKIDVRI